MGVFMTTISLSCVEQTLAMQRQPPISTNDRQFHEYMNEISQKYNLDIADSGMIQSIKNEAIISGIPEKKDSKNFDVCTRYSNLKIIHNPETFIQEQPFYATITDHMTLPEGLYAYSDICPSWIGKVKAKVKQGFKIHVSAKPETAFKIAQIVLPILEENNMDYKIMYDLPYMRYTYYLTQYRFPDLLIEKNKSTQAGKFIVIYPEDVKMTRDILKKLDDALKSAGLTPSDFEKVIGDAMVGDTGGIFVRYASNANGPLQIVDPFGEPFIFDPFHEYNIPPTEVKDDRRYPWPDFMNDKNAWKESDSPFGDLKTTWVNPDNPKQVITWESRPESWRALQEEK